MSRVKLRAGTVQPVWAGHPWVFAQAVDRLEGGAAAGDEVDVIDPRGNFLGRGFYSPKSAIAVRILSRRAGEAIDAAFFRSRLETAYRWRRELLSLPSEPTTGYRLVHSEGDGLGGIVVDVFHDVATVQLLSAGMKQREDEIFSEVARVTGVKTVVEIGVENVEKQEGFKSETRIVRGPDIDALRFRESGFDYEIPLDFAQKTGFYFDQRDNRAYLEKLCRGKRVLDAFSYVGSFALAAARGGASEVLAIDSSASAVATGATIARKNGLEGRIEYVRADTKSALPELAERKESYDVVVLDPPKLVPTARHLDAGRRAYRRVNSLGASLVRDGGLLVSCSCSAAMRPGDFLRTLGAAARDSGRELTLLHMGSQGSDHPVLAGFPEGRYLKCAVFRVSQI